MAREVERLLSEYPGTPYGRLGILRGLTRCVTQREEYGIAMHLGSLKKAVPPITSTAFFQLVQETFPLPTRR